MCTHCGILGLRKSHEYLYQLFGVLTKQTTCKMKALQVEVYIQQWSQDGQGAKFMLSLTSLVSSEMTIGM